MPKCDGLPADGRCPQNVNNRSVKLSQGDLMLCPSCEATRFPYIRTTTTSTAQPLAGRKTRVTTKNSAAPVSRSESTDKNVKSVTESKPILSSLSDDEEECVCCNETITAMTDNIRCDVCKHVYHQTCTGLSEEVFTVLTTIIRQAGWVCQQCRNQIDNLKCTLAKVSEELADVRVSLTKVIAEVNYMKNASSVQQTVECNAVTRTAKKHEVSDSNSGKITDVTLNKENLVTVSQLRLEFHRAHQDITRRKHNVVISGLPETCADDGAVDKESDCVAFVQFCEENLSVKPVLARSGCVRLGKFDGVRPRRLLVHLTSETSVTSILAASKALRWSDDSYIARNVYFNPDLNPVEAKLAYERRQQIRQRRQAAAAKQTVVKQTSSLNVHAEPYVTCPTDIKTASSSSVDGVQHTDEAPSPGSTSPIPINLVQSPFLKQQTE